jgi:hypothetical protein
MRKASKLGVSLGVSEDQIASSIKNIKNIEVDRRITYLKNNLHSEMEKDPTSLALPRAANLCEDLIDDIEEPNLHIDMHKKKKSRKGKVKEKDVRVSVFTNLKTKQIYNPI